MTRRLPPGYTRSSDGLYRKTVEFQRPDWVAIGKVSRTILVRSARGSLLWSEKTGNCTILAKTTIPT